MRLQYKLGCRALQGLPATASRSPIAMARREEWRDLHGHAGDAGIHAARSGAVQSFGLAADEWTALRRPPAIALRTSIDWLRAARVQAARVRAHRWAGRRLQRRAGMARRRNV